jgi:hypothetical protein
MCRHVDGIGGAVEDDSDDATRASVDLEARITSTSMHHSLDILLPIWDHAAFQQSKNGVRQR